MGRFKNRLKTALLFQCKRCPVRVKTENQLRHGLCQKCYTKALSSGVAPQELTGVASLKTAKKRVIIMRGLPGSGKSTKAKEYQGATIVSADDFFCQNETGEYQFDPSKLGDAHGQCMSLFEEAIARGDALIVVDNTNMQIWEFQTYMDKAKEAGYTVEVDHVDGGESDEELHERGSHGVPLEKYKDMRGRFEEFNKDAALNQAKADSIIQKINAVADKYGYKVYAAGGYVRDLQLGKQPNDLDVVVDGAGIKSGIELAKKIADEVEGAGSLVTYEKPGDAMTAELEIDGEKIDFAAPRKETYDETRTPIVTEGTLQDDAERRDFTINALFQDLKSGEVIDLTGKGLEDIKNKTVRMANPNSDDVFIQDPLRLMRGVSLSARMGFKIDPTTYDSMKKNAGELNALVEGSGKYRVSRERVRDEINKLWLEIEDEPSKALNMMKDLGIMEAVSSKFKEMFGFEQQNPEHHDKDVWDHSMSVVDNMARIIREVAEVKGWEGQEKDQKIKAGMWAALLHDVSKPEAFHLVDGIGKFKGHEEVGANVAKEMLQELRLANEDIQEIVALVKGHMRPHGYNKDWGDKAVRKLMREMGDRIDSAFALAEADTLGGNPANQEGKHKNRQELRQRMTDMEQAGQDAKAMEKDLLSGNDIMALGVPQGPLVGKVKAQIDDMKMGNPALTREEAEAEVLRMIEDFNKEAASIIKAAADYGTGEFQLAITDLLENTTDITLDGMTEKLSSSLGRKLMPQEEAVVWRVANFWQLKMASFDELTQRHIRETGSLPGPGEAKGDPIKAYVCPGCNGKDSEQCRKCTKSLSKSRKRRGLKTAKIVKRKGGYHVTSEEGKNLGGPYKSKGEAEKRLSQVEHFKKANSDWVADPEGGTSGETIWNLDRSPYTASIVEPVGGAGEYAWAVTIKDDNQGFGYGETVEGPGSGVARSLEEAQLAVESAIRQSSVEQVKGLPQNQPSPLTDMGPEDVATVDKVDANRERDRLMDEMNQYDPGSIKYEEARQRLEAFGAKTAEEYLGQTSHPGYKNPDERSTSVPRPLFTHEPPPLAEQTPGSGDHTKDFIQLQHEGVDPQTYYQQLMDINMVPGQAAEQANEYKAWLEGGSVEEEWKERGEEEKLHQTPKEDREQEYQGIIQQLRKMKDDGASHEELTSSWEKMLEEHNKKWSPERYTPTRDVWKRAIFESFLKRANSPLGSVIRAVAEKFLRKNGIYSRFSYKMKMRE